MRRFLFPLLTALFLALPLVVFAQVEPVIDEVVAVEDAGGAVAPEAAPDEAPTADSATETAPETAAEYVPAKDPAAEKGVIPSIEEDPGAYIQAMVNAIMSGDVKTFVFMLAMGLVFALRRFGPRLASVFATESLSFGLALVFTTLSDIVLKLSMGEALGFGVVKDALVFTVSAVTVSVIWDKLGKPAFAWVKTKLAKKAA